jgi:thiol-disulfide isomerase/thioredoxin
MKQIYLTFSIIILCLFSLNAQEIDFKKGSFKQVIKEAQKQNKNIFIDFTATWCGPCKMLESKVFSLREVGEKYNSEFICYKVMSDDKEFKALSKEFDVISFPTLLYITPNKKVLYRQNGFVEADRFLRMADLANGKALSFKELYKKYKNTPNNLELQQELLLESVYEIKGMKNKKEAQLWIKRVTEIFYSYFEAKPKAELVNKTDLKLIRQYHKEAKVNDEVFDHVLKYILDYTEITKDPSVCKYLVKLNNSLIMRLAIDSDMDYKIPLERLRTDLKPIYQATSESKEKDAYEAFSMLGEAYYSLYTDKDEQKFVNLLDKYFAYMGKLASASEYTKMVRALYKNIGEKLQPETNRKLIEWFKTANNYKPNCDILIFMADAYTRLEEPDHAKQALNQALMVALSMEDGYKKRILQNVIKQKLSVI